MFWLNLFLVATLLDTQSARYDTRGGGVALMFKKSLNVKFPVVKNYNSCQMVNAEIKFAGQSINLYEIYRPPPSSENHLSCECFLDEFGTLLENSVIDPRPLLITGDFNFHVDNN